MIWICIGVLQQLQNISLLNQTHDKFDAKLQATDSDGLSPSQSWAFRVEVEPSLSPGPSKNSKPKSWWASTFYFMKKLQLLGPSQKVEPEPKPFSKFWAWGLKTWTGFGQAQARPVLCPITSNRYLQRWKELKFDNYTARM